MKTEAQDNSETLESKDKAKKQCRHPNKIKLHVNTGNKENKTAFKYSKAQIKTRNAIKCSGKVIMPCSAIGTCVIAN